MTIALLLTWTAEWSWYADKFHLSEFDDRVPGCGEIDPEDMRNILVVLFLAIFFLFARTPYLCGTKHVSFWIISAIAGLPQFWLVYTTIAWTFYPEWFWLLPLVFALPAASGVWYLVRKEHVSLASGDPRLVSQGLAMLIFVSLAFPVQLEREWVALGWALEGVALILLFRWIPNWRLPGVTVILLAAALVRLAFNVSFIGCVGFAFVVLVSGIATSTPVVAPFLAALGIILVERGYTFIQRGSFLYIPEVGPVETISPTNHPAAYWSVSAEILGFGIVLLALSAYAVFCLLHAHREDAQLRPERHFG